MTKNNLILVLTLAFVMLSMRMVYAQDCTIGTQVWATVNLDVSHFRNGDSIPEAKTNEEWVAAGTNKKPAWCSYNNVSNTGGYGKLYNWYAVNDPRGLAPNGYHIPTEAEWTTLWQKVGISNTKVLRSGRWTYNGGVYNGTSPADGFKGLPSGFRTSSGAFTEKMQTAYWWSSMGPVSNSARAFQVTVTGNQLENSSLGLLDNNYGCSVRCLKN